MATLASIAELRRILAVEPIAQRIDTDVEAVIAPAPLAVCGVAQDESRLLGRRPRLVVLGDQGEDDGDEQDYCGRADRQNGLSVLGKTAHALAL
jgi:hypothetical protein